MPVLKALWRRKWMCLVVLLVGVALILLATRKSTPSSIPTVGESDADDAPEEVVREGVAWFNDKDMSPGSRDWKRYLEEIRKTWIVRVHRPNVSYVLEHPEIKDPSMGQAEAIRSIFNDKRNGFFVECGAYDGETRSNTLVLEKELGWTGLLIEADPENFSKMFLKNRNAYLSPTCLSITPRPTVANFLMARNIGRLHDPTNNTEKTLKNSMDVVHTGRHIKVQCFPFAHYVAALKVKTIDYFSLDIEGNEIDVLETIPFDQVDITTLSVEHVHNRKGRDYLIKMMDDRGYFVHSFVEREHNLANDVIFVKKS